MGMIDLESFTW